MNLLSKRAWLTPSIALGLAVVAGCDQPGGPARPQTRAPGLVGVDLDTAPAEPAPPPAPVPPPETKREPLIGAKTQDIRDAQKEKQAGAVTAPKQISKDPFRVYGNAYVSSIGQLSIGNIKKAVDLYQATNGEYPKTHEEFMEKIIKENNIVLPGLPPYQKYAYDVTTHELGIMEYPDLKK